MSYLANIAFSLELITLAVGLWMLNKSKSAEVCCAKTTKIIGYIIMIGSLVNMTCTLANTVKDYAEKDNPRRGRGGKMERTMDNNQGIPGNMMQNPMQNNQTMQPPMQQAPMQNNQQMMQQPLQQMPNMQNQQMPNNQMPNSQMGNPGSQPPPMRNGQ